MLSILRRSTVQHLLLRPPLSRAFSVRHGVGLVSWSLCNAFALAPHSIKVLDPHLRITSQRCFSNQDVQFSFENEQKSHETFARMREHLRLGQVQHVGDEFRQLVAAGFQPTVQVYNTLLHTCSVVRDLQCAKETWKTLINDPYVAPDVASYGSYLAVHVRCNQIEAACKILSEMELKGAKVKPNLQMYNIVLDGLARTGNIFKANLLMKQLLKHGLRRDHNTYRSLMKLHGKTQDIGKLRILLKQAEDERCIFGVSTLTEAAVALSRCDDPESAYKCIEKMVDLPSYVKKAENYMSNLRVAYNSVIWAWARDNSKAGAPDGPRVIALMEEMRKNGVTHDVTTFNALIKSKGMDLAEVFKVVEQMKLELVTPNEETHSRVLIVIASTEGVNSARDYLKKIEDDGVKLSTGMFDLLLSRCSINRPEDFLATYDAMRARGLSPSHDTACWLSKGVPPDHPRYVVLEKELNQVRASIAASDELNARETVNLRESAYYLTQAAQENFQGVTEQLKSLKESSGSISIPLALECLGFFLKFPSTIGHTFSLWKTLCALDVPTVQRMVHPVLKGINFDSKIEYGQKLQQATELLDIMEKNGLEMLPKSFMHLIWICRNTGVQVREQSRRRVVAVSSSTGSYSFSTDSSKPVPLAVVSPDSDSVETKKALEISLSLLKRDEAVDTRKALEVSLSLLKRGLGLVKFDQIPKGIMAEVVSAAVTLPSEVGGVAVAEEIVDSWARSHPHANISDLIDAAYSTHKKRKGDKHDKYSLSHFGDLRKRFCPARGA